MIAPQPGSCWHRYACFRKADERFHRWHSFRSKAGSRSRPVMAIGACGSFNLLGRHNELYGLFATHAVDGPGRTCTDGIRIAAGLLCLD